MLLDDLRHHGRNREGGADGVDGDLGAQLGGQGAGQHIHGALGGTVAHVAAAAAEGPDAPDGGEVDDAAVAVFLHDLTEVLTGHGDADYVDVHHIGHYIHGEVEQAELLVIALGVDQNIRLLVIAYHGVDQGNDAVLIGGIHRVDGHILPHFFLDLTFRPHKGFHLAAGNHDFSAVERHRLSNSLADTAGTANHDCYLTIQTKQVFHN